MSLPSATGRARVAVAELLAFEQFAQVDGLALRVRDFDADHGLSGQRGDDAHRQRAQREREIVLETHDPLDLDPRRGLELVHRDHGARVHLHDVAAHAEVRELLLENPRVHDQAVAVVGAGAARRLLEHRDVGEPIGSVRPMLAEREALLAGAARRALLGVIDDLRRTLARTARGRGFETRRRGLAQLCFDGGLGLALRGHAHAPRAPLAPHGEAAPTLLEAATRRREPPPRRAPRRDRRASGFRDRAERERGQRRDRETDAADRALERDVRHRERAERRRQCVDEQRAPVPEHPDLVAGEQLAERAPLEPGEPRERRAEQRRHGAGGKQQQRNGEAHARGGGRKPASGEEPRSDHCDDRHQQVGGQSDTAEQPRGDERAEAAAPVRDPVGAPERIAGRVAPERDRGEDREPEQPDARRLAHEGAAQESGLGPISRGASPLRPSHGNHGPGCPSNSPPGIR